MFGARNFFLTAARAVGDSLWNYVTALFSTTSTNGAQNNTFLDSSTNNFTITRNGNTTQGSFSPYEPTGYWSNYFNGTDAWLSIGSNAAFGMGTGDCTIECWYYPLNPTSGNQVLVDLRTTNTAIPFALGVANGTGAPYAYNGTLYSGGVVANNAWNHIAFVRSGSGTNNCKLYLNGSQVAQFTDANNWGSAQTCAIGRNTAFNGEFAFGYISNVRIVKGTAVYTANFTPPTTPLTAIANTSLLTCQSNRFLDNSSNAFVITANGSPSVQAFSPLGNTTPYSTAAVGGSAYFDGSGDSLTTSSSAISYAGDFCIECWFYTSTTTVYASLYSDETGSSGGTILLNNASANGQITVYCGGIANFASTSTGLNNSAWHHVAFTRSGSTVRLFIDGKLENTTTASGTITSPGTVRVGSSYYASRDFSGYIAGFRIVSGSAVYTSAFTPPTAPPTAITNTSLLLNYTNAGIFDAAAVNDFETVGNAQVSTTQAKFGPTSMYFDGSGDWLASPAVANLSFGTGNFTIEMWMYHGTGAYVTAQPVLLQNWASTWGANEWSLHADHNSTTAGKFSFWVNNSASGSPLLVSTSTSRTSTWNHIAVVRYGSTFSMFVNGNLEATATFSGSLDGGGSWPIYVGGPQLAYDGYIDELRITKGYARYWYNNFPVPTSAFPVQYAPEVIPPNDPLFDYVTMLLPGNGTNGAQNNTFLDSSANNYTITRNGNSTQGAFTPYGPNWSNYLDGDGDNLTLADNAAFEFGSGSFSIDIWINPFAMKGYQGILGKTDSGGDQRGWILYFETSNIIYFQYGNGSWVLGNNSFGTVPVNNWTHLAVTRDTSNVWRFFKNGILVNSTTNSGTINDSNSLLYIGKWPFFPGYSNTQDFGGYMSNARIVKGGMPTLFNTAVTAIGTQVFTPPTAPYTGAEALTAGSVSLLTCQSNRFIDNSSNAFAITVNGTPGTQRFSPFNPPASYSAATNGGSGYFDGSGDKVLVATNSNMTLGTNDFTVEFWAYPLSLSGERCFTTQADPTFDTNGYWIGNSGTSLYWLVGNGSSWAILRTVGTLTLNAWNHIALTRSGTTFRAFINGVLVDTQTSSVSLTNANNNVSIGGRDAGAVQYSNSYISGYRVLNGTCLYTATFTPPTTPPTVITNTQLLTNFTNAGVIDNAMMNDLETVGSAQISTAQSKFGGGSILLNGTNSGLAFPPTDLGSGDFTVEWWANQNANFSYFNGDGVYAGEILAGNTTGALGIIMYSGSAGVATNIWLYIYGVVTIFQPAISISLNQWNHFALTRANGTWRLFVNGNQVATSTSNGTYNVVGQKTIGWRNAGGFFNWFPGYIDDFRITRGIARYVQNFTPPTQAFQTQ